MTAFAQLLCGWAVVNLESSGTGVGVVARSGNWPPALGSTTRELGALVTWNGVPAPPEAFALEFIRARNLAVAVMKTPSNARPGTCVAHLIAGEPRDFDGATALGLFDSGLFRTHLDDPGFPTDQWTPLTDQVDSEAALIAAVDAYLDLEWLPALLGYTLAHLAGRGPAIELHVEGAHDALAMLRALYGMLPRKALRDLTFCTSSGPSLESVAITAVTRQSPATGSGARRVVTPGDRGDESDTFVRLGQQITELRRAGVELPETLAAADEIGQWCFRRHLRTLGPAELDDDRMAEVIADPELSPDWFADPAVATRAVHLAVGRPTVAKSLARIDHRPDVRRKFESALTETIRGDTREQSRVIEVARQLGFDLDGVVADAAWQRLESGSGPLTAADAKAVWPKLRKYWVSGNPGRRRRVSEYLLRHQTLREQAIGSRDRALVYDTLSAEVDDPAVHTGNSRLLRTAMQSQLGIVAQLVVNVSTSGRDRYALEQILGCAPADRLPALIAECARYPALAGGELMKALTLTVAEPADLAAALRPAWPRLRKSLGLPETIETLVVLDAAGDDGSRNGARRKTFGRNRGRIGWDREEVAAILRMAVDDRHVLEDTREILSAAIHSDPDYVATCLAEHSRSGDTVLKRVLATTPADQLPALVTACARHWELEPFALLRAVAALDLEPGPLVEVLGGGWPWLRTRLDVPQVVTKLLVLDATEADPATLKTVAFETESRRGWQFWR
ncbi:hypothetical protein [Nocardia sp. NBC_00511]|uniref:hypothetical protein n=1 Tax=Nocardia sp. NBC_00511 TaxID=2903591 RepID=UPI0030E26939